MPGTTYPNETHASEHFTWHELDPLNHAGPGSRAMLLKWCKCVGEPLRAKYGRPVHITSGFRSTVLQGQLWKEALAKYGSVYKAKQHVAPPGNSQHEVGTACDVYIAGIAPKAIAEYAATLPGVGGVGLYATFTHIDVRPLGADGRVDRW